MARMGPSLCRRRTMMLFHSAQSGGPLLVLAVLAVFAAPAVSVVLPSVSCIWSCCSSSVLDPDRPTRSISSPPTCTCMLLMLVASSLSSSLRSMSPSSPCSPSRWYSLCVPVAPRAVEAVSTLSIDSWPRIPASPSTFTGDMVCWAWLRFAGLSTGCRMALPCSTWRGRGEGWLVGNGQWAMARVGEGDLCP